MEIKELFSGIAVIIDNDIDKENTSINKIKNNLINNDIPVACFKEIPNKKIIDSFGDATFIVIDWDFVGDIVGESILGLSTLKEESQRDVIDFIKEIRERLFVPVFIFSGLDIEEIRETLIEENLYSNDKVNRIFIKSKSDIESEDELFSNIKSWMKQIPSVYAFKMLEKKLRDTKNKMFVEWHDFSPQWVTVIWDMLKEDSSEVQQEFGEFLLRNLMNRANQLEFEEDLFTLKGTVKNDELMRVMEYERYIKYEEQPEQAYTGDLFKVDKKYYLNIRAQCDLSRKGDKVELYLLSGKCLESQDIIMENIRLTSEGDLRFPDGTYKIEELKMLCDAAKDNNDSDAIKRLGEVNDKFAKFRNLIFFGKGEILEKKPEVIVACIDNGKIVKFRLDIQIKKFKEIITYRIGRLLPPYITRIQQKCSQYIVREGTMPLPRELFEDYN